MSEMLTFANYSTGLNPIEDIYLIGATDDQPDGVVREIAKAFDYDLPNEPEEENLGGLIKIVGPAEELQKNIGLVVETVGEGKEAVELLHSWINRSGLLIPVEQSFVRAQPIDKKIDLAVITGGVRNWMERRATRLEELGIDYEIGKVLLVAGQRKMSEEEGEDVVKRFREADYMSKVVLDRLCEKGFDVEVIEAETTKGDEVMDAAAKEIEESGVVDLRTAHIAVVSNAAGWLLNAGQFKRAISRNGGRSSSFDFFGDQLTAVSDSFPLGTGTEPTLTHQNPYSAIGMLLRNAQELVRHY